MASTPIGSPTNVLVVEDEMVLRMRAVDIVEDAGFTAVEAVNADEALSILEERSDIALLFSDIQMPGSMDGFGLAQWVRRERPWLKVILTSGAARTAKEAGDLCEQAPILAKPYDHAELERHIRSLLAR
jgi:CheY-like chemotaxis protein